jgi:site-specific DNA recombinase
MSIRALIFAAVSTEAQATPDKASLDQQVNECRAAIQRNGWVEVDVIRLEGQSRDYLLLGELMGKSAEYSRLVDMIRQQAVHVVVCAAYDRLWRTDAIRAQLAAVARESDVRLYSVAQPIPLDSDDVAYWMQMFSGAGAEMENREKVNRHRRGMAGRVAEKGLHPMGQAPYGYARSRDSDEPPRQVPAEITWVKYLFEQLLSGVAIWQVSEALRAQGVRTRNGGWWWISTLRNIARNPFYAGGVRYRHWKWSKDRKPNSKKHRKLGLLSEEIHWTGQHEPVISRADWERVQQMLDANPVSRDRSKWGPWALRGLLRCGYCQWGMTRIANQGHEGACCSQYTNSGGKRCQCNRHPLQRVNAFVLAEVKRVLYDPHAFAAALADNANNGHQAELEALYSQRSALNTSIDGVYRAIQSGRFDIVRLADDCDALQSQLVNVEQHIARLESATQSVDQFVQTALALSNVVEELDYLEPAELGQVYRQLIEAVYVRRKEPIDIHWLIV